MDDLGICHVQVKGAFIKTYMVSPEGPLGPLEPDSVRVRTTVLGLSTNNISYAVAGAVLHWWDCFPVSTELPSPYNDREKYGIAPGWGYATVIESTTSITPGTLIRGFFPLSTVPVDLCLKPASTPDHWIETSPHRSKVMTIYQRYIVSKLTTATQEERDMMANESLIRTLWWSTWLLNTFSLSASKPFINPGGMGLPWTEEDADLSNTVIVCLTASSKTAMALAHELRFDRASGSGPKTLLGITSDQHKKFVSALGCHDAVYNYEEALHDGAKVLQDATKTTKRIVVIDFGARGKFTGEFQHALALDSELAVQFIRVGTEKTAGSPEELKAIMARSQAVGMTQMNASAIQDQAFDEFGEKKVIEQEEIAWNKFLSKGGIPGVKISWSYGMVGTQGLQGAWARLTRHEVSPDEVVAVYLGQEKEHE